MANELQGKKIAFLAANAFEESELMKPWEALKDAGAQVELVSLEDGEITALNEQELKAGSRFASTRPPKRRTQTITTGSSCRAVSATRTSCAPTRTPSTSCGSSSSRESPSARCATGRGRSSKPASSVAER